MLSLLHLALLLPFAAALVVFLLRGSAQRFAGWIALAVLAGSFALVLAAVGGYPLQPAEVARVSWVPSAGLDLSLRLDGLSVFFALVVTGMGMLIAGYALAYFDAGPAGLGRFFGSLCLFAGAMLGTVLANNLLLLFLCWELTGVASFLLIGFNHDKAVSCRGARMALLTTSVTGLALLAGVLVLGGAFGTFELDEILQRLALGGVPGGSEEALTAAFLLCCIGIFGKSAQFPFQFWLPNAMAAPTPVSAYLHSATMVKLGVFLTARLMPCFAGLESWMPVLTVVGFGTMLLGAVLAVLSHDLKAVLAHSTVSQLGLLIGYYGLFSAPGTVAWDYVHILNHVGYKACLFMVVGIIDHSAGTRDLRELGGLRRLLPLTTVAAAIGLATMAGLPPTTGFLSKEMLLKTAYAFAETHPGPLPWWPIVAVVIGSTLKVVFSLGILHRAFLGPVPAGLREHFHRPSFALQLPPLLLALGVLVGGIASVSFGRLTDAFAVEGQHLDQLADLSLVKMVTEPGLAFFTTVGILVAGAGLYATLGWIGWHRAAVPRALEFDRGFDALIDALPSAGKALTRALAAHRTVWHLGLVGTATLVLVAAALAAEVPAVLSILGETNGWPAAREGWLRWLVVPVVLAAAVALVRSHREMVQVFSLSVIGAALTVYFALFRAPDLALTQLLVESASLLLILLFTFRLRRHPVKVPASPPGAVLARGALAGGLGLVAGGMTLLFQSPNRAEHIGDYHLAASVPWAKGANAVNTILIDFRGFDTLLEITVLLIAALGCLGLLMRRRRAGRRRAAAVASPAEFFPLPRNFILHRITTGAFFALNLFALYLLLRGHNQPGGGFIAGLVTGLSVLLLGFVLGLAELRRVLRLNGILVAAVGLLIAVGAGLVGPARGLPFLHHVHLYTPDLPLLGEVYVGTPLFFDLGVYAVVVGILLKIIFPLMKSVHNLPAFVAEEEARYASPEDEPIDVDPGGLADPARRRRET